MGRTPCCEKVGLKKGPWTPEEDQKLLAHIEQHGHGSWRALPGKAGLQRCGKSCRLRWTNYLRPDIKRGKFSLQEEQTIIQLHALLGNRWSAIATHLPKRTDNEIKNYWNTHLKKRLDKMGIDPVTHKPKNEALTSTSGPSKNAANLSHMAQWESARLEAEARLARQSKLRANSVIGSPVPATAPDFPTVQTKPVAPCLDILKAWSGTWTNPPEAGNGPGDSSRLLPPELYPSSGGSDLESPTSTLSFSDTVQTAAAGTVSENAAAFTEYVGNSGSLTKAEGEEEWNNIENSTDLAMFNGALCPLEGAWGVESIRGNDNETADGENFMTRFTDLLLNNSTPIIDDDHNFSDDIDESKTTRGSDYCEDNKNYWNSILNLVNSSPTNSSVF